MRMGARGFDGVRAQCVAGRLATVNSHTNKCGLCVVHNQQLCDATDGVLTARRANRNCYERCRQQRRSQRRIAAEPITLANPVEAHCARLHGRGVQLPAASTIRCALFASASTCSCNSFTSFLASEMKSGTTRKQLLISIKSSSSKWLK